MVGGWQGLWELPQWLTADTKWAFQFSLKYETACAALCQPHTGRDTGSPILPNTQSKDRQQSPNTTILISFVLIWAAEEYDDDNEYWRHHQASIKNRRLLVQQGALYIPHLVIQFQSIHPTDLWWPSWCFYSGPILSVKLFEEEENTIN